MSLPITIDGVKINKLYVNGIEISKLVVDGNIIFGGDVAVDVVDAVSQKATIRHISSINNVKSDVDFSLLTPVPYSFTDVVSSVTSIRGVSAIKNVNDIITVLPETELEE